MTSAHIARLWLQDFRAFGEVDLALGPGMTVFAGANGQGKTTLLEAIGWVARARSFRGVPDSALVRVGADRAIVRAEVEAASRRSLFEAEIPVHGRRRIRCNRQAVTRARDLHGLLRATVFAPDDLELVKSGPTHRRDYLDELLAMLAPRYEAARQDHERVLRQRNALLRAGVHTADDRTTLDVFDEQLVRSGGELTRGRLRLVARLVPVIAESYAELAASDVSVDAAYEAEWAEGPLDERATDAVDDMLLAALTARRREELARGQSLVGPHRDEWRLRLAGLDARTHASQGEQRTLALALRLAGHAVCTEVTGTAPVLLLDDVFSELDPSRARALVTRLPEGQTLLTTAGAMPADIEPEQTLHVAGGQVGTSP